MPQHGNLVARQLYVGFAFSRASEMLISKAEEFKSALRQRGYDVFNFIGLTKGTSLDVYEWEIKYCIRECDGFIGICDEASIGLGWELGESVRLGKPTLAVAHVDSMVTRLVLGAAEAEPNLRFETYEDLVRDIPPLVDGLFASS
ncbi:MAG TPA: hypothetical protein VI365_20215 [Trebonia sp.]